MKSNVARALGCCAAILLCGLAEARAADPAFREVLRRYVGHHKEAVEQEPPPGYPAGADRVIALEYAVLLRRDGLDAPVDPAKYRFQQGDQIRVRIQPFSDLYVYVFFEDERGCRRCLLPSDKNSPRLAKHDQPVELPTDGSVFEFEAAAREETLVLVASEQPDSDLTTLCEAVCKKRDEKLTPEERTTQIELKDRNEKALASIQNRQAMAVAFRGRLSSTSLARVSSEMNERGAADAFLEEPPGERQSSTLVMLISKSAVAPRLSVMIPLKAAATTAANVP